jgi:hypothetical protein
LETFAESIKKTYNIENTDQQITTVTIIAKIIATMIQITFILSIVFPSST